MSEHYPRIRIDGFVGQKSFPLIRESVSITFYMKRSHQEVAQDMMRSLEVYRRAVGPNKLGWYADPHSGDWEEFDDNGWAYLRRKMSEEPATSLWLCESSGETTGYEILYRGRLLDVYESKGVTSGMSFFLPTEYLEEHGPGHVQKLALELASGLPFNSGHAGLAFNYPETQLGATDAIRDISFRHPGLDILELDSDSYSIGTRVNGVHWLNFLGQPVLEELGGTSGLRARLHSPDIAVQELDSDRAVVTLGTWPEAGDTEKGHTLPAYRELARVLEPWLYMDRARFGGFSEEDMKRWERRFLD